MSALPPSELPRQAKRSFYVEWGGTADLSVDEIWPDGNAPENPTRDDVIAVMQQSGSVARLCRDWSLEVEGLEVDGKDSGLR